MINFPANPSLNQTHTAAGRTWVWNGSRWALYSATSNVIISTASVPESGNLYFTNARAIAALTAGQNITIEANGLIVSAALAFTGNTSGIPEGSNLYYTNARVYANVIGLIPNISSKANVTDLNTSNVVEGSNLYYTNARVYANVIGLIPDVTGKANVTDLTSSNVIEGSNLYYTNARVYANVIGLIPNVALKANVTDLTSSNVIEGSNLYYTNARVYANVIGLIPDITGKANTADLTTSNVVEGSNLYYTNARVYANVIGLIPNVTGKANVTDLNTSNVVEGSNLYFTNARSIAALTGGQNITIEANGLVVGVTQSFTGNTNAVPEGSANLYYTNARVYANVIGLIPDITNKANIADLNTSNIVEGSNLFYTNARVYAAVDGNLILKANVIDLNTSNVIEGSNLYYTNARVYANVIGLIPNVALKANITDLTTSNVIEGSNLYYTNARVYANVIGLIPNVALKANITDLTTSNVIEGSNLYFTNVRSIGALIAGQNITIEANGLITGASQAFTGNTTNVPEGANLYYTNARVYANVIGLIPNVALKANIVDLTTSNVFEGSNLYYTNARVYANVIGLIPNLSTYATINYVDSSVSNSIANIVGTAPAALDTLYELANALSNDSVFSTTILNNIANNSSNVYVQNQLQLKANVTDLNTSNVVEGSNLYYTNARVYANIIGLIPNVALKANIADLNTSNIVEGSNLYFTNTRSVGALTAGQNITIEANGLVIGSSQPFTGNTTNVPEGANLYYTNARVYANVIGLIPDITGKANTADLTTSNVIEGSNLYYTNARVYANIIGLIPNVALKANIVDLTTSNVIEGSNLYFTNARGIAALTGGQNITIEANGLIIGAAQAFTGNTTNVPEGANLYYTNARVYANVIGLIPNVALKANTADLNTSNIVEGSNLYFTNARVLSYLSNIEGNLIPATNLVYNLGSATSRWKDIYLSGNTIDLGGANIKSENGMVILPLGSSILGAGNISTFSGSYADLTDKPNTSIISEGSNLYYTNARVHSNLIAALPNYTGNLQAGNANVTGTLYTGNIISSGGSGGLITGANLLETNYIRANVWEQLYTSNVIEGSNLYYTNARVYANVIGLIPNIFSKANITDLTTSNVIEGANLYFTNARGIAALTAGQNIVIASNGLILSTASGGGNYDNTNAYANVIVLLPNYTGNLKAGNANVTGTIYAGNIISAGGVGGLITGANLLETNYIRANVWEQLYTSNVIEGSNFYYTNARVYANVIGLIPDVTLKANVTDLNTSNVVEGSNLYYTNARVYANVIGLIPNISLKANTADLTTSNVIEGSNLYYTNARVYANIIGLIPNVTGKANVADLNTSNVVEGSNLYFTNTRAVSAFTAGENIVIAANGLILSTANGGGGGTLTGYVDVFTADGASNNYTLSTTPSNKNITFVAVQGVLQPKVSYNISGTALTFDSTPPNTAYIEVTTLVGSGGGSGGSSITWYIVSANTTMVASSGYFVDTTNGPKTMTLPTSATLGDTIRINDLAGNFASNNLTVARNSHKIQGLTEDLIVDMDQSSFGLVYSNTTYGWKVLEL